MAYPVVASAQHCLAITMGVTPAALPPGDHLLGSPSLPLGMLYAILLLLFTFMYFLNIFAPSLLSSTLVARPVHFEGGYRQVPAGHTLLCSAAIPHQCRSPVFEFIDKEQ